MLRGLNVAESVGASIFARAEAGAIFEGATKGCRVAVAHAAPHLVDRLVCALVESFGVLDSHVPQVSQRAVTGRGREPSGQGSVADPETSCEFVDLQRLTECKSMCCWTSCTTKSWWDRRGLNAI
jgi:hypothetical protein